jgi:hypothetical protein
MPLDGQGTVFWDVVLHRQTEVYWCLGNHTGLTFMINLAAFSET